MAVPAGVKLDDGTGGYASNCFPVRSVFGQTDDAFGGAWLVAHRAEQRRRFKAILCAKPKSYEQLKEERRQREREEKRRASASSRTEDNETAGLLDGFFLMKHCCVEDPSDLCSVNMSSQDLVEAREEDFQLFDNVAYVNAAENLLPFEAFKNFPIIRELELPVNGLRNLKLDLDDFPYLEVLDLSYNNLSQEDILTLGILPKLKVLHLSGNGFTSLPSEMAQPVRVKDEELSGKISRFASLEILYLDENKLTDMTTFANLAGLRKLKRLNLDKNQIYSVPHLRAVGGKMVESEPPSVATTPRHATPRTVGETGSLPSSRKSSRGASRKSSKLELEGEDGVIITSTSMMDTTLKDIKEEEELEGNSVAATTQIGSELFTSESPPPFPELEFLSLAYNQISEEEGLLAVAAWPMLTELVIHNNPLTMDNSGDPPLLTRYLVNRLGIHLTRLKPREAQKPGPKVPVKKTRQVSTVVPKVPKVPVEQLMLEAPSRFALPSSQLHTPHPPSRAKSAPSPSLDQSQPLPPIQPSPPPPKMGTPAGLKEEVEDKMSRTKTWTEHNFGDEVIDLEEVDLSEQKKDTKADDPVFLTQVDDQAEELAKPKVKVDKKDKKKKSKKANRIDSAAVSMAMPEKYKGYELLLDAEDDPTIMLPTDIHGNVKALEYALKHPVVYKDNEVDVERLHKPFEPYERSQVDYGKQFKTKAERLEDMMKLMKDRVTTQEISLAAILEDKKKFREEYPEAEKLLSKIQAKYKTVRAASMKDSSEAMEAFDETMQSIKDTADKLENTKKAQRGSSKTKTPTT